MPGRNLESVDKEKAILPLSGEFLKFVEAVPSINIDPKMVKEIDWKKLELEKEELEMVQKNIQTEKKFINELCFLKTHRDIITEDKQETSEEEVKETNETINTSG